MTQLARVDEPTDFYDWLDTEEEDFVRFLQDAKLPSAEYDAWLQAFRYLADRFRVQHTRSTTPQRSPSNEGTDEGMDFVTYIEKKVLPAGRKFEQGVRYLVQVTRAERANGFDPFAGLDTNTYVAELKDLTQWIGEHHSTLFGGTA